MSISSIIRTWMVAFWLAGWLFVPSAWTQEEMPLVDHTGGLPSDVSAEVENHRVLKIRSMASQSSVRSRLFPSETDKHPGNAAPIYLRQNFEASERIKNRREFFAMKPTLFETKLDDPRLIQMGNYDLFRTEELERAANRKQSGWEYPLHEEGGMWTLLSDVQESRIFVLGLAAKARLAMAQGKPEDAERFIRIGFGLARHIGDSPFMVVKLVHSAECSYMQFVIEELLQQPGAPNYYWDLVSLPRPMVEIRGAIQWEAAIMAKTYPQLNNLDALTTEAQWNKLLDEIMSALVALDTGHLPPTNSPEAYKMLSEWVKRSRERLPLEMPEMAKRIDAMCDAEVGLRYWWARFLKLQDGLLPASLLELPHAIFHQAAMEEKMAKEFEGEQFVWATLMPFLSVRSMFITHEVEQRFGLLRTVEAIRHWSAIHDNRLPSSLSELDLPVPVDALSGQAFEYRLADDKKSADLRGKILLLKRDVRKRGYTYKLELAE